MAINESDIFVLPDENQLEETPSKSGAGALVVLLIILIVISGFMIFKRPVVIDDGLVGIMRNGSQPAKILESGIHFIDTTKEKVDFFDHRYKNLVTVTNAKSNDDVDVSLHFSVFFKVNPKYTLVLAEEFKSTDELMGPLEPFVSECAKRVVSEYKSTDIAKSQDKIANKCRVLLANKMKRLIAPDNFGSGVSIINTKEMEDLYIDVESECLRKLERISKTLELGITNDEIIIDELIKIEDVFLEFVDFDSVFLTEHATAGLEIIIEDERTP